MASKKNTLKLVLAGDGGVGKTTLIYKIIGKQEISEMTRGVNIETFAIDSCEEKEEDPMKIVCWDLGGQPQFRFFLEDFLGGTDVVLFVFDLNRYSSLENLEKEWVPLFQKEVPVLEKAFFIGNKLDLGQTIDDDIITEVAEKFFMPVLKVSATEGTNVEQLLEELRKVTKPNGD